VARFVAVDKPKFISKKGKEKNKTIPKLLVGADSETQAVVTGDVPLLMSQQVTRLPFFFHS
jgi:hypothetical protein